MTSLSFIGEQITIYGGFIILVTGIIGGIMSIIVFLSLKTFRQNSCAFYLTIMSFFNIGQLIFGLFSRIMIYGYSIDWTVMSIVICKTRITIFQFCSLMSYSCLCLATIDQYFATCSRPRWQKWSNIKIAHRLVIICFIVWIIALIPYPIYLNHIILRTGKIACATTNTAASQYRIYVVPLLFAGYIPDFITVFFGILAYNNVQEIAYRTIPLVRREQDKQLTTMTLFQVVINLFTNIPCVTMNAIQNSTSNIENKIILEQIQFAYSVLVIIFYLYFANPFYVYFCVSERFRRQTLYVLFCSHVRHKTERLRINRVVPSIEDLF